MNELIAPICFGIVGGLIGAQYKNSSLVGVIASVLLYAGFRFV
jgi:predicted branched-subunit amino acid permease